MSAYAVEFPELGSRRHVTATFDATDTPALTRQVARYCQHFLRCGCTEFELDMEGGAVRMVGTNQAWPFVVYRLPEQAVPQWAGYDQDGASMIGNGDSRRVNSRGCPPPA